MTFSVRSFWACDIITAAHITTEDFRWIKLQHRGLYLGRTSLIDRSASTACITHTFPLPPFAQLLLVTHKIRRPLKLAPSLASCSREADQSASKTQVSLAESILLVQGA